MAKITVHPSFEVGEISNRLFAAFLEPIGTMVNGFMYNPKHPTADEQGFRTDVINALKATGLPAVRLPGGNFVSAWQWKDSIGPKSERKVHLDPAWYQFIPNDSVYLSLYLAEHLILVVKPVYDIYRHNIPAEAFQYTWLRKASVACGTVVEILFTAAVDTHDVGIGLIGIYNRYIHLIIRAAHTALAVVAQLLQLCCNNCFEALGAAL